MLRSAVASAARSSLLQQRQPTLSSSLKWVKNRGAPSAFNPKNKSLSHNTFVNQNNTDDFYRGYSTNSILFSSKKPTSIDILSEENEINNFKDNQESTITGAVNHSFTKFDRKSLATKNRRYQYLKNCTNKILHKIPVGSMTKSQCDEAKNLVHHWSWTLNKGSTKNSWAVAKAGEVAYTMELILERLIEEFEDGLNEYALSVITNTEYNVIMNAYMKSMMQSAHKKRSLNRRQDIYNYGDENENNVKVHDSFYKVEALFERMLQRLDKYSHIFNGENNVNNPSVNLPKPDIITYNTILAAYSNQSNYNKGIQKAEEIIRLLESGDEEDIVKPDTITYNTLMNLYANQVGEYGFAQKAEDVLLNMSKMRKDGSNIVVPNTTSFNIVLKAWRNSGGGCIETAKRAEEILRMMLKLYNEGHEDVRPDGASISTVITAFTRPPLIVNDEIFGHFLALTDLLLDESSEFAKTNPKPVVRAFNTIIDIIAKSEIENPGEKAEFFLKKLTQASLAQPDLQPTVITYSNIIGAYINDGDIHKAMSVLSDMMSGRSIKTMPNAFCFNKCLNYFCKQRNVEAAEDLYHKMYELSGTHKISSPRESTALDILTYNMMMEMYMTISQNSPKDIEIISDKALSLLYDMEGAYESGALDELDIFPYEVVLSFLQRRSALKKKSGISNLSFEILLKMIKLYNDGHLQSLPRKRAFNLVLSSLSKEYTKDAAEKSMEILRHIHKFELGNKGLSPDSYTFNHVAECWVRSGAGKEITPKLLEIVDVMEESPNARKTVNTTVFQTILHGLSLPKNCDQNAATAVLDLMIALSKENSLCKPNSLCFNVVLKSYCLDAKSKSDKTALLDAHRLLFEWIKRHESADLDVLPDVIGFNTLISCWASSKHKDSVSSSNQVFKAMGILSTKEGLKYIKPDTYTYSAMLKVYASNRLERSQMAHNFIKDIGKSDVKLDIPLYNGILYFWARSSKPYKAVEASKLLDNMIRENLESVESYNTVLRICAETRGNKASEAKAIEIGIQTYKNLLASKKVKANDNSFATAIKVIHRLSVDQEQRGRTIKGFFDDCCNLGLLSNNVIRVLKQAIPESERMGVLGYDIESSLKREWIENL